jgi:hypothetical protein
MTSLALLTLGSLLSVATPTATYSHPSVRASQPVQTAHLTRQWVSDGRGQVWRPEPVRASAPATPAAARPRVQTFASLGR